MEFCIVPLLLVVIVVIFGWLLVRSSSKEETQRSQLDDSWESYDPNQADLYRQNAQIKQHRLRQNDPDLYAKAEQMGLLSEYEQDAEDYDPAMLMGNSHVDHAGCNKGFILLCLFASLGLVLLFILLKG